MEVSLESAGVLQLTWAPKNPSVFLQLSLLLITLQHDSEHTGSAAGEHGQVRAAAKTLARGHHLLISQNILHH